MNHGALTNGRLWIYLLVHVDDNIIASVCHGGVFGARLLVSLLKLYVPGCACALTLRVVSPGSKL